MTMSNRAERFEAFCDIVMSHIDNYTVPQYGDAPDDQLSDFTVEDCLREIKKYLNRASTNARGDKESLRDLLKMAHYCSEAFFKKLETLTNDESVTLEKAAKSLLLRQLKEGR